jgi:hypothetical protein
MKKTIEIEMPDPTGYRPTSGTSYEQDCAKCILREIPDGYELVGKIGDVEPKTRMVVQHIAYITIQETMWKGIPASDRKLWFGIAKEGMEAPWLNAMGACLVKIWDIRREPDNTIMYGIGNETKPSPDEITWVPGGAFFDEWPQ